MRNRVMTVVLAVVALCVALCTAFVAAPHHELLQNLWVSQRVTAAYTIACVGDSITYGQGVLLHRTSQSYPAYLQAALGKGYLVENYGVSGRTLLSSGDKPYTRETAYGSSLAVHADLYIIMLGTNDSKPLNWNAAEYEKQLKQFVEHYQMVQGSPDVVLMQPPRAFASGNGVIKHRISNVVISGRLHSIVARVGQQTHSQVIDLYSFTRDHPEWFKDGVHPNAEGNEAIADYIHAQLVKAGKVAE